MRLRLFARLRWPVRPGWARSRAPVSSAGRGDRAASHRRREASARRSGPAGRGARRKPAPAQPPGSGPFASPVQGPVSARPGRPARKPSRGEAPGRGSRRRAGAAGWPSVRAPCGRGAPCRAGPAARRGSAWPCGPVRTRRRGTRPSTRAGWRVATRDCGPLEKVLYRDWATGALPPPEGCGPSTGWPNCPAPVSERLAEGLDAIYVGPGGVPDLDEMGRQLGVPLPSGRATWDACAGAYGERKIIIGTRPSSTPDVVCQRWGMLSMTWTGRAGSGSRTPTSSVRSTGGACRTW